MTTAPGPLFHYCNFYYPAHFLGRESAGPDFQVPRPQHPALCYIFTQYIVQLTFWAAEAKAWSLGYQDPGTRLFAPSLHVLLSSSVFWPRNPGPRLQGPRTPAPGPLFQYYTVYYPPHCLDQGGPGPDSGDPRPRRPTSKDEINVRSSDIVRGLLLRTQPASLALPIIQ